VSTERCAHGNVVSDTVGDYRCYECQPLSNDDIEKRDARIAELERVVAELAFAAGINFNPGAP
jgi:hypothetical protein